VKRDGRLLHGADPAQAIHTSFPDPKTDAKWEIEKREVKRDGVEETPI